MNCSYCKEKAIAKVRYYQKYDSGEKYEEIGYFCSECFKSEYKLLKPRDPFRPEVKVSCRKYTELNPVRVSDAL